MDDLASVVAERDALLEQLADVSLDTRDTTNIARKYWAAWRATRADLRTTIGERDRARDIAANLEAKLAETERLLEIATGDTFT